MKSRFYGRDLASVHHREYGEFVSHSAPRAISLLRSFGIRTGTVLDIGCGAGQLSRKLLSHGYKNWGLDVSRAMIGIARRQVPHGEFKHGSILNAKLPRAAAALAIGEIFNYLKHGNQIRKAFSNIYDALDEEGVLIFDLLEPSSKKYDKRQHFKLGSNWAIFVDIQETRSLIIRKISTFIKSKQRYRRQDEIHEQGLFHASEVARWLRREGFQVSIRRSYGSFNVGPRRRVIIARKTS